ncbi:S8 family serine peptidase [Verrucosispora sp. WMMA2121]|uniref:S8 family serine peptidase n=1 Tax=Verrucosispora sp. WMMA2121 TaxID=3015164 RepID=UPI0022B6B440|nr:S8 family serine peptidase [Verrucosispora sp. WMMA2121]MCZ7420918.1 S8 family serine peptidase [Verrucosispora sp. WMMA2121]
MTNHTPFYAALPLFATIVILQAFSSPTAEPREEPAEAGVARIRSDQWHLRFLEIDAVHKLNKGRGSVVAVPDTGVSTHPDLHNNVLSGTDVIDGGEGDGRQDRNSHGTAMAGLIAAHGRGPNAGALGVAPEAKILPIFSTPADGEGHPDALAAAIDLAVAKGADVISISSVGGSSPELIRALGNAIAADIVVVAGAGNQPTNLGVGYPASHPGVIAVGGIGRDGDYHPISVTGPEITIVAPAVDLYSTSYGGHYSKGTGTSGAAAIVAGAAALVRAKYPYLPADEVAHRLTATAIDKGPPGRDDQYGYGVIDLVAALTADVPPRGFGSAPADAPDTAGPSTAAADGPPADEGRAATVRGLVTLGVLVAAGGAWALVARHRRRSDDPPPRITR